MDKRFVNATNMGFKIKKSVLVIFLISEEANIVPTISAV